MADTLAGRVLRGADAADVRFDEAGRVDYLNASEALTCVRKQFYKKAGAQVDGPDDWGYARRGQHGEKYVVACLAAANVPMLFTGEDQIRIVDEDLRIACTPDGIVEGGPFGHEGKWLGIEIKTIDPRTNLSNLPREEHVVQLQIGMAMFEKHREEFPELGDAPISHGVLLYMDASNYNTIHEYRVETAPKILDRLRGRANRVLDSKSASRLPREGKEAGGRECKQRCKFTGVCGVDGASTSTGQGHTGAGDPAVVVAQFLTAKAKEEAAKAERAAAGEQIKALIAKSGTSTLMADGHVASLSVRKGSVSYAKVVQEHLPDLDLEPYRGEPTEVLTVK